MEPMKALVTLLNKKMFVGFVVMFKSFLANNSWFDQQVVILDIDLTQTIKNKIKKMYKDVVFEKVKFTNYEGVNFNKTDKRLQPTYFKLDVFRLSGYDRVVFIDSDTVILQDVSELFNSPVNGIAGIKAYKERQDSLRDDINSGVLVISGSLLGSAMYKKAIQVAASGYSMPDQKTINILFSGKFEYFNKSYNVEKRMEHTKRYKHVLDNIKIVHYVAGKPWEDDPEKGKYPKMEKIWHEWNKRK